MNLFRNTQKILYVAPHLLKVVEVSIGKTSEVANTVEFIYDHSNFEAKLEEALKQLNEKSVDVLLNDSFCYVLTSKIARDIEPINERSAIFEQVKETVPEELEDADWDYKVIIRDENFSEIIAFAPVKAIFGKITSALDKNGCVLNSLEPMSIAATRHTDPFIGFALKDDLKGSDADVLNMARGKPLTLGAKMQLDSKYKLVFLSAILVVVLFLAYQFWQSTLAIDYLP